MDHHYITLVNITCQYVSSTGDCRATKFPPMRGIIVWTTITDSHSQIIKKYQPPNLWIIVHLISFLALYILADDISDTTSIGVEGYYNCKTQTQQIFDLRKLGTRESLETCHVNL